jgi:hypothetical protein
VAALTALTALAALAVRFRHPDAAGPPEFTRGVHDAA